MLFSIFFLSPLFTLLLEQFFLLPYFTFLWAQGISPSADGGNFAACGRRVFRALRGAPPPAGVTVLSIATKSNQKTPFKGVRPLENPGAPKSGVRGALLRA